MMTIEFLMSVRKIPAHDRRPYISDANLEDLINQINMTRAEKRRYDPYPILGTNPRQYIPRGLLDPHAEQAWENHGQSLDGLAKRGGLSWVEALAIIEDKKLPDAEQGPRKARAIIVDMAAKYLREQPTAELGMMKG